MKEKEHILQVACVRYFRLKYPKHIIFAIPNGGMRNIVVAAKMKAEGATAGVPDLFVPHPNGIYCGMFIEMKNGKCGRLTANQKAMIERLTAKGYYCCVAHDIDEFIEETDKYFRNLPF